MQMASDNWAPGFHEVNSFPISSKPKDLSIRKFLSGVKKVGDTTVVALLEQEGGHPYTVDRKCAPNREKSCC